MAALGNIATTMFRCWAQEKLATKVNNRGIQVMPRLRSNKYSVRPLMCDARQIFDVDPTSKPRRILCLDSRHEMHVHSYRMVNARGLALVVPFFVTPYRAI